MNKICVFCGEKPSPKTKEHIIPKWLIELTGDLNRKIELGFIPNFDNFNENMSFNKFVFPACKKCNEEFGELEAATKPILINLLNEEDLSFFELNTFFSWLDKIRIGLWLAYLYLGKNYLGINPQFFINNRIDQKDRMTIIFKTDFLGKRLNFSAVNTPAFQYMPCCFGLLVNNFFFVNISRDFLFSSRLGLPYPKDSFFSKDGQVLGRLSKGRSRVKFPLFIGPFQNHGIQIFQPMIKNGMDKNFNIYNSEYIKNLCFDFENGIGNIYLNNFNGLISYPLEKSSLWIPKHVWKDENIIIPILFNILKTQIKLIEESQASFKLVDDGKRKEIIDYIDFSIGFNKRLINELSNNQ